MSRPVRVEYPGALYHAMARGVARMPTFVDDQDRRAFLDLLSKLVEARALEVHAFCLMPNHYHLLLRTPSGELSRWMRQLNSAYAHAFNLRHRRVGHLWQGRYKAILVQDAAYLKECSRYIHLNPNRAKLTRPAERYRWSSYRNYVGGPSVVPWVSTRLVLGGFGDDAKTYRAYVESGKGEKLISPFERAVAGLVLGSEAFAQSVRKRLAGLRRRGEQPALSALQRLASATPEAVEKAVDEHFPGVGRARRGRLLLYAQRTFSRLRSVEVAARYGRRPSAVTMACTAIERERRKDRELARRLAALSLALAGSER